MPNLLVRNPGNKQIYYLLVLAVSLFLGLFWVLLVNTQPVSDFKYYHELAESIADGGQWGDTYTTVGYPVFLAFFYKVFGPSLWVAKGLNLFLSVLNNLLVLAILRRSPLSERGRKVSFALFALFPATVFYNSVVATEILFSTLLFTLTWLYFSGVKHKYVFMGILVGLNTLIKPFFIAYFLVIFFAELLSKRKLQVSLGNAALILSVSMLVLVPWLYRNYLLMGEFTWVSNNGGIVLYINNNSQNQTGMWMPAEEVENSLVKTPEYLAANATEKNKMLSKAAKTWIFNHPEEFVMLGLKRLKNTFGGSVQDLGFAFYGSGWNLQSQESIRLLARIVTTPVYWFGGLSALAFTLRYLLRLKREKINSLDGYLLILLYMFVGIYFLTEGQSRYAFPTLLIFVYFFCSMLRFFSFKQERK